MMEESFFPRNICRLCGEENSEGSSLFQETHFQVTIITLINKYLPIRISDNDELPKFICQACSLQLYSTIFFLEVVITGQAKLRDIFQLQKTDDPSSFTPVALPLSSSSITTTILPSHHPIVSTPKLEPFTHNTNVSDPLISSSVSSQIDAQREQYKNMFSLMSPSQMLVTHEEASHTAHSSTLFSEFGDDIKKIFSLPLDETPLYSDSHDLCTKTIALNELVPKEPPKKKRGRPRKDLSKPPVEPAQTSHEDQNPPEVTVKRKRKVPQRYLEGIQHAELEKIFSTPDSQDVKPSQSQFSLPPTDSLMLDDLEPFHIAASDHIMDAANPLNGDLPSEPSLAEKTVPDPKDVSAPLPFSDTAASTKPPQTYLDRDDSKSRKRKRKRMYLYCEVCKKSFRQILKLKLHRHTHNPLYKCVQCSVHFHIFSNWETHHLNTLHSNYEIVDQNGKDPIQTEDSHVIESFLVDSEGKITCRHCCKEFLSKEALMVHMKLILNKSRAYTCPICRDSYPLYSRLRQHIAKDHKSSSRKLCVCDICHKQFTHPSSVLYHKETAHSDEQYQCGKCDKKFRHQQLLQRHQLVHTETRPFKCSQCPLSFKTKISRTAHSAKHTGAKAYVCEICQKTLTHRSSLISHYRWHQGIKPHQCPQCPKAFNQKGNLKEHFRIHTGEKPFACGICTRSFTTYSQHKLHMKRHTGEKPHRCEHCHKGFLSAESYKCHMRRHAGEKPFLCTVENCGHSFVEAWALKKHQRVHHKDPAGTPELPRWRCNHWQCDKSYQCAASLQKHMKTHSQDQQQPPQDQQDQQSENNAALLNIDLSLLDMTAGVKETVPASTSEELDKLPRTDSVAAFSEAEGNVFYLYDDTTGLIPLTVDKNGMIPVTVDKTGMIPVTVDKSGMIPVRVDKNGVIPVTVDKNGMIPVTVDKNGMEPVAVDKTEVAESQQPNEAEEQNQMLQNQSFELVTDGSKFHLVRVLTSASTEADSPPSVLALHPGESSEGDAVVSMPSLEVALEGDKLEESGGEENYIEFKADEEGGENYIEFITEDGGHVRMMGVSYNHLQLLSMDPSEIQMFTTKN